MRLLVRHDDGWLQRPHTSYDYYDTAALPDGSDDDYADSSAGHSRQQPMQPQLDVTAEPAKLKRAAQTFDEAHVQSFREHWLHYTLLTGIAVVVVAVVLVSAVQVYVIIKKIKRKAASPLTPLDEITTSDGRRRAPLAKGQAYGSVGSGNTPVPASVCSSAQQPPVNDLSGLIAVAQQQEPIRIRTRGLLERRGSSASLTIDLSAGDPSGFSYSSPTRECSIEDYLQSAGNRLTRRQLRACLKHSSVLHQEFLDIPLNHPAKPLDLPGCNHKNRYKSIWPNERTRVILKRAATDPFEKYINANYIRGYDDEPMAFIATQGPLPNTVDDFWLMAWQEKAPCIVMMTKLNETNKDGKNKQKCEPYLPAKTGQYGQIGVTVRSTMPRNGYYVRDLEITNGTDTRLVKHYWFMGWPDQQAAPTSAARQLLQLAADVQNQRAKCRQQKGITEAGPIIVHCSAGLGRTGCFVAICIGCRQLQEENMVDVLGNVCQMRLDRGGMIQTPEQYEFIHHALAVYEQQLCESPTTAALPLAAAQAQQQSSHSN